MIVLFLLILKLFYLDPKVALFSDKLSLQIPPWVLRITGGCHRSQQLSKVQDPQLGSPSTGSLGASKGVPQVPSS